MANCQCLLFVVVCCYYHYHCLLLLPLSFLRKSRFLVYGDMGTTDVSDDTVALLTSAAHLHQADLVLHAGDISYADGYEVRPYRFIINNKSEL